MGKKRKVHDAIQEEEKRKKFHETPKVAAKHSQFDQKSSREGNKQRDQLVRGNQSCCLLE